MYYIYSYICILHIFTYVLHIYLHMYNIYIYICINPWTLLVPSCGQCRRKASIGYRGLWCRRSVAVRSVWTRFDPIRTRYSSPVATSSITAVSKTGSGGVVYVHCVGRTWPMTTSAPRSTTNFYIQNFLCVLNICCYRVRPLTPTHTYLVTLAALTRERVHYCGCTLTG